MDCNASCSGLDSAAASRIILAASSCVFPWWTCSILQMNDPRHDMKITVKATGHLWQGSTKPGRDLPRNLDNWSALWMTEMTKRERERTKPCSQRCQKPLKQHAIKCNQFNNFATPINYSNQRTNSTRLNDSTTYSSAIQQLIPTNSAISKVASETLATTTLPKSEASASLRLSTRLHKSSCEILCVRKVLQMMRISSGINMY